MPTFLHVLLDAPVPIAVTALLLRNGPSAVLVLVAGVVAAVVPGKRGARALAVLRVVVSRRAPRRPV
jgi:hypothetical protein